MKIFVGTLYSGENEYEECLSSIKKQSHRNYEHFIFRDLPKFEAHRQLYGSFLARADEFDLLIKVDADTVLISDTLFADIVRKMSHNEWLDVFSIGIHDFFSGVMINGLNTYRNTVRWKTDKNSINADIVDVPAENCLFDDKILAPAAHHCKNPSPFQAFHFGIHRGLKSIQKYHSTTHWNLLSLTYERFKRMGDIRLGYAMLGSEMVYSGSISMSDMDYTDPKAKQIFEKEQFLEAKKLLVEIRKLKLKNWGFLPADLRRRLLRKVITKI